MTRAWCVMRAGRQLLMRCRPSFLFSFSFLLFFFFFSFLSPMQYTLRLPFPSLFLFIDHRPPLCSQLRASVTVVVWWYCAALCSSRSRVVVQTNRWFLSFFLARAAALLYDHGPTVCNWCRCRDRAAKSLNPFYFRLFFLSLFPIKAKRRRRRRREAVQFLRGLKHTHTNTHTHTKREKEGHQMTTFSLISNDCCPLFPPPTSTPQQ